MTSLLAKSPRGRRTLELHQHLLDTEQAASLLFRDGSRWGEAYPRFFKLPATEHGRFLLHLRLAALFHDLGKANEGFQKAMHARTPVSQPLRHEHLSALVLAHLAVQRWLSSNPELDQDVILAAVLSHRWLASITFSHSRQLHLPIGLRSLLGLVNVGRAVVDAPLLVRVEVR